MEKRAATPGLPAGITVSQIETTLIWDDPFLLDDQLTDDETHDTARLGLGVCSVS